jgi:ATP-dependent helicase/nuclease subunit A
MNFTQAQTNCIEAHGSSLLISAGAGSGKTRVLTERLLHRCLSADSPEQFTDFLVITFTNAAAAELRSRIIGALSERLAANPNNRRLKSCLNAARRADISTIHGFCSKCVRENAAILGVSPDFSILDAARGEAISERAVSDVLEREFERADENPEFMYLVECLFSSGGKNALKALILSVFDDVSSLPYPAKRLAEFVALHDPEQYIHENNFRPERTPWGKLLLEECAQISVEFETALNAVNLSARLAADFCTPEAAEKLPKLLFALGELEERIESIKNAAALPWAEVRKLLDAPFSRKPPQKGEPPDSVTQLFDLRDGLKKKLKELSNSFLSAGAALYTQRGVFRFISELCRLVGLFSEEYSARKNSYGRLDFSDLEQLALKALRGDDGRETPYCRELQTRYTELLVDEYQDVSSLQEEILNAVSKKDGGGRPQNLIMVGDIKQSVYGFRSATPEIFAAKLDSFALYSGAEGEPQKLSLSSNFRSSGAVLDSVNEVFRHIFSAASAGFRYTSADELFCARGGVSSPDTKTEITAIETSDSDEPPHTADDTPDEDGGEQSAGERESDFAVVLQAKYCAAQIGDMLDSGFLVPDGTGGLRPCEPTDFAILLRSTKGKIYRYTTALSSLGIPSATFAEEDLSATNECALLLNLLRIVNNPREDTALAACMLSPVFGFTPDEMAELRLVDKTAAALFDNLEVYAAESPKARDFLKEFGALRLTAAVCPPAELAYLLAQHLRLFEVVSAWNGGGLRRENLQRFLLIAQSSEESGVRSLPGLIEYLSRSGGAASELSGSGVRIMSVHKSKGLEFPVVFFSGIASRFNAADLRETVLFDAQAGLGAKFYDPALRIKSGTLSDTALKILRRRRNFAEETRVLYVAMTRAREKLIMVGAGRDIMRFGQKPAAGSTASSFAEMILPLGLTSAETKFISGGDAEELFANAPVLRSAKTAEAADSEPPSAELAAFAYPHGGETRLPSKLTVTEVLSWRDSSGSDEAGQPLYAAKTDEMPLPHFLQETAVKSATSRGSAVHKFLQFVSLSADLTADGLRTEAERLFFEGTLSEDEKNAVDFRRAAAFFASDIGSRLVAAHNSGEPVYRELKFSRLVPASELYPEASPEDDILLQGVIDCAFCESGKLVLLDFKTNRVASPAAEQEIRRHYASQLRLYGQALEEMTGLSCAERELVLLDLF